MESDRISAVRNWPPPTTVKEVQRFLGFANYYRRFIQGFGQVVAPITSLLKGSPVRLQWSAEADRAFGHLRALFTSAPVLVIQTIVRKYKHHGTTQPSYRSGRKHVLSPRDGPTLVRKVQINPRTTSKDLVKMLEETGTKVYISTVKRVL